MRRLSTAEVVVAFVLNLFILPGAGTILLGCKGVGVIQALVAVSSATLASVGYLFEAVRRWLPAGLRELFPVPKLPWVLLFALLLLLVVVWVWTVIQTLALIRRWAKRRKES